MAATAWEKLGMRSYLEHSTRYGLDMSGQLKPGELVHVAMQRFAKLGNSDQLPQLLSTQVIVPLPRQVLLLYTAQNLSRYPLKLPQWSLQAPNPSA